MPFPVIKLVGIFFKQLSKPLAGYIKRKAKESPFIKNYICIPPAQWYHRLEVRLQMMKDGSVWSKEFKVTPLEEAKAIEIGADMLGEVVIFSVGAGVIALEYWRSIANAAKKERKQNRSIVQLRRDVNELTRLVEEQHAHIDKLTDALHSIKGFTFNLVPADLEEDRRRLKGLKS